MYTYTTLQHRISIFCLMRFKVLVHAYTLNLDSSTRNAWKNYTEIYMHGSERIRLVFENIFSLFLVHNIPIRLKLFQIFIRFTILRTLKRLSSAVFFFLYYIAWVDRSLRRLNLHLYIYIRIYTRREIASKHFYVDKRKVFKKKLSAYNEKKYLRIIEFRLKTFRTCGILDYYSIVNPLKFDLHNLKAISSPF